LGAYEHPPFGSGCTLSCFSKDGVYLYTNVQSELDCDYTSEVPTAIDLIQQGAREILVFSNPSQDNITIEIKGDFVANRSCFVYNQLGQMVYQSPVENNMHKLSMKKIGGSGIYLIKLVEEGKVIGVQKIVTF